MLIDTHIIISLILNTFVNSTGVLRLKMAVENKNKMTLLVYITP